MVGVTFGLANWSRTTWAALSTTAGGGEFNWVGGGADSMLEGEDTQGETEVTNAVAEFVIPGDYVKGTDLTLTFHTQVAGTGTMGSSTIDLVAKIADTEGGVGGDICATGAQTYAAKNTWYDKAFTITWATINPGDSLRLKMTTSVIESSGSAGLNSNIGCTKLEMQRYD